MPATRPKSRQFRSAQARTVGLVLAAAVLVIFAVVVLIFVAKSPSNATGVQTPVSTGPAPDVKDLAAPQGVASVHSGKKFFAQMVAKDDPSRITGEFTAERYEPLENQRFKLEKPEGWAFLRNGYTVHVQADGGRTYAPDQGAGARPHDAVLEGNVEIKVFEPRTGGKRPSLDTDVPFATVTTNTLNYDSELGQVQFPNHFVIDSLAGDYVGTNLTCLFNDVQQRLEWLHVEKTDRASYNPRYKFADTTPASPAPAGPAAKPASGPVAAATNPASPVPAAPAPAQPQSPQRPRPDSAITTLYHLVCTDRVVLQQGDRKVEADELHGWARLVDNKLQPGAVGGAHAAPQRKPSGKTLTNAPPNPAGTKISAPGSVAAPSAPAAEQPAASTEAPSNLIEPMDDQTPVTLTFKGPLDVRPLSDAPGELNYNDVFVRFTSKADDGTRATDAKTKAVATGSLLEYGATRREVALAANQAMGARILLPGSGEAQSQRFEMPLDSGTAHVPAAGLIKSEEVSKSPAGVDPAGGKADHGVRSLAWSKGADFRFLKNDKGDVTQVISEVRAGGDVHASDGKSVIGGESLIAQFKPVSAKASRLDHLQVAGKSAANDGRGGSLSSDTLDVSFVQTPGKPDQSDPSVVTANGTVRAEQKGSVLTAGYLQAQIARDQKNELSPKSILARDHMTFDDGKGVTAKAEQLDADPVANTAHLTGPAGTVQVSKEGTTILGQDVMLWQDERRMRVAGEGSLEHDSAADKPAEAAKPQQPVHATAKWTKELVFEDATGIARCIGGVQAVVTKATREGDQQGTERDTVDAEEVHMTFTPAPAAGQADQKPAPGAPKQERRLLTVHGVGADASNPEGWAKFESRRYAPAQPGQDAALEQMAHLESATIDADNDKGTLRTPGPGKFLVMDRRAVENAKEKPAAGSPFDTSSGARGTSLFEWKGSMDMDRQAGLIHLNDHVTLDHTDEGKDDQLLLDCERLTAHVKETSPAPAEKAAANDGQLQGQLTSADAEGGVWMRSGARELVCDTLHYDALKRQIDAKSAPPNMAELFDPKSNAPIRAREIFWDLVKNQIDVHKPGTVVAPR